MAELIENPKRKPSFLEKLSTKPKERVYLGFDTETSQTVDSDGVTTHHFELCCTELFVLDSYGNYESKEKRTFWDVDSFHAYIVSLYKDYTTIFFVAHNMTFDAVVARIFDLVSKLNLNCEVFNPRRASYFCRFKGSGVNLILIDSLNFLSGSLKNIGDSLGFKKLEMPKYPIRGEKWERYCRRDVDVMVKGMRVLSKFLSKWHLGQLDITRASIAFKIFRRYYLTTNMLKSVDLEVLKMEYRAYHGGRVECFHIGTLPTQDYYLLDFNSLYPSVMKGNQYSIRVRYKTKKGDLDTLRKFARNHGICANVKIMTSEPCLPYRDGLKVLFPVGEFWSSLSTPEIKYALKHRLIADVNGFVAYYQRPIFTDYITEMHKLKTMYKKKGNEPYAFNVKILMNSLYGKFAQKISQLEDIGEKSEHSYGVYDVLDMKTREVLFFKIINYKVYQEMRNMVGYNSMPQIAAEVSSYGRMKLWDSILLAGRSNVYYCDTDSLLVNSEGLKRLKPLIKKNALGYLELEKTGRSVTLRGAKDYTFMGNTKIKGIPKKSRMVNDGVYEYDYWFSTTEALRDTSDRTMKVKPMTKHLSRKYTKGRVQKDGSVLPKRITNRFMNE